MPYFVSQYFHGAEHDVQASSMGAVTPYGSIVLGPQVDVFAVWVLPFVPALTEADVNMKWFIKNGWIPYKLEKTEDKPNGTYMFNPITPSMNVGDTLVYYDTKPADPA